MVEGGGGKAGGREGRVPDGDNDTRIFDVGKDVTGHSHGRTINITSLT